MPTLTLAQADDLDRLLHDNPDAIGPVPAELVALTVKK